MSRRFLSLFLSILLALAVIACVLVPAGPAAAAKPLWYLAEGTTAWGFDTQISIQNPNTTSVNATVTYMGDSGVITSTTYFLWATSQTSIHVNDVISNKDFSAKIECTDPTKTIAVDRTMLWMGGPGSDVDKNMEAHSSVGVTGSSLSWFLPEGSSAWGFETWLLIQNPNPADAHCTITYMIEGGTPVVIDRVIPANSRKTYSMENDIGKHDASIRVVSGDQPVIAERAMYRNERRLGTESIGTTQPASEYMLAEGSTAWGFTTYVLIQNPGIAPANIGLWFMTPSGPVAYPGFSIPARSRKTIRVNDFLPNTDCSIYVQGLSGATIIAERSMYWGGDTVFGEAAHDSIGVSAPHPYWYLPEGSCTDLVETWTLVQNMNPAAVNILVTYMSATGTTTTFTDTLQSNTRKSYKMADMVPPGHYSTGVSSLTAGSGLIVERSMYWDTGAFGQTFRTAGSDTIGAWED